MRRAFVLLGLAACYDPHATLGAPCSDVEPCPTGQACIAGTCGGAAGNAPDAPADFDAPVITATDRDGDGIDDVDDNCPDVPNPDQGNEDGDKFGDACDPCPIEANDTPSDPDGDGVADGCDPHPTTPGDKIVLFEGFHHGVPTSWQVIGNTMAMGDDVALLTPAGNFSAIVPPIASIANGTVTAGLIVDATVGTVDSATTVVMPYDPTQDQGVFCELYAPNAGSTNGRYISLWDSKPAVERNKTNFAWTTATPYRVALTRTGNNYTCSVTPAGAAAQTTSGSTSSNPAQSKPAIAAYGANARASWMLVISSP